MKKNSSNYLWGGILILIGIFLAGRALDLVTFDIFFDGWWSLFIIIPCFIGLFSNSGEKTSNLIGLCIGLFLLLSAQDIIEWSMLFPLCFATALVIIGFKMLFPNRDQHREDKFTTYENTNYTNQNNQESRSYHFSKDQESTTQHFSKDQESTTQQFTKDPEDTLGNGGRTSGGTSNTSYYGAGANRPFACTAIFSGRDIRFDNEVFHGAVLSAVLGGIDLDLRNAIIRENVVIDVKTVLGGVDIYVPNYVRVVVNCTPILGGVDNRTITPYGADEKTITIYLNATCVLGGIDVK